MDSGYKWTLSLALGDHRSKVIVSVTVVASSVTAAGVSLVALPGAALALGGVVGLIRGASARASRKYIDAGMALTILALIAFG